MPVPADDPILTAPSPTPFTPDDAIDFQAIERNVERWLATPLSGFMLNSENGEEAFLSESERLEIVRTVDRVSGGRKLIIANVDCPSVTETLRLAEQYVAAGAELLRVRIPRLTTNVRGFFQQVAARAAAPLIISHQMAPGLFLSGPTASGAPAEVIGELVALDNVFGYIMSDNLRFESRARLFVPKEKRFWTCNGTLLLTGAALGANGGSLMLGNVFPRECLDVLRLMLAGRLTVAQALQSRLLEIDFQILSRGAAGIKAALELFGYEMGGPRRPSLACDQAAVDQIRNALLKTGLHSG